MYNRIKEILDDSGLNQQEFAERIAIAPATLSNILKGRQAKYNTDMVMSIIAQFPQYSLQWLMSGNGDKYVPQPGNSDDPNSPTISNGMEVQNGTADNFGGGLFGADGSLFGTPSEGSISPDLTFGYNSAGMNNGPENATGKNGVPAHASTNGRAQAANGVRQAGANGGFMTPINPQTGKPMTAMEINQMVSYFSGGFPGVNPAALSVKNIDKKPRSIREIRVFYDDDTFEVFSPSKG